mmetsp:Transcript_26772/g.39605  ORF Transcript_26772/g.39605 Transcript_26772/m.39605 type:complete len:992 (+) Transcript_26772:31-3006(+)
MVKTSFKKQKRKSKINSRYGEKRFSRNFLKQKVNTWFLLVLILSCRQLVDCFIYHPRTTRFSYQRSTSSFRSRTNISFPSKSQEEEENLKDRISSDRKKVRRSEEDIVKNNLSDSKDKAISALSQPSNKKEQAIRELSKSKNRRISGGSSSKSNRKGEGNPSKSSLSDGLSSWEDFLGVGKNNFDKQQSSSTHSRMKKPRSTPSTSKRDRQQKKGKNQSTKSPKLEKLPSIADLFPPDLYNTPMANVNDNGKSKKNTSVSAPPPTLDGVLPISDLFYRSSQSMNVDEEAAVDDDDELPFSAEQSDQLTTEHNKIKIRNAQAKPAPTVSSSRRKLPAQKKMVRRGIEMLVGGVPINADPPQRYIDLLFNHKAVNWNEAITLNSRDFGPMYHSSSAGLISKTEQALFCEHFVHSTLKWGVCPKDLRTIVKRYISSVKNISPSSSAERAEEEVLNDELAYSTRIGSDDMAECSLNSKNEEDLKGGSKLERTLNTNGPEISGLGFGTFKSFDCVDSENEKFDRKLPFGGELVFSIGVSKEELEMENQPTKTSALKQVLTRGIVTATECTGFDVSFDKLILTDLGDGTTMISGEFQLTLKENKSMSDAYVKKEALRISSSLAQAMDDGDMQLAMAAAAKEERGWPEGVRDQVVSEFLFDDDDGDGPLYEDGKNSAKAISGNDKELSTNKMIEHQNSTNSVDINNDIIDEHDGASGMSGSKPLRKDDIFLGGGTNGVFWDYSEQSAAESPYQGNLGLRLVDATVQRAKERFPRVIAIGDVHGCIDELQNLLRECDYRPGDLVVFLGDLVSKGPDSISVIQMAREIGAIGVRGNHDFEVVRWHQAIQSGVDPPVVGSEHFHIASCLSKADMKWMHSLPWYISSKELGALFVHAGFVSGIRLARQNPRLMMNMRSILPDGTVTSKFFNNWPWARLWDGPQTVLFGHDADRGLQQYEHAIGLDTGCVYGGRLTACILPEKRLVSVSAKREYFKYRRKHYN